MPYALCPMPYALCPVVPHLSEKGYILWLKNLSISKKSKTEKAMGMIALAIASKP